MTTTKQRSIVERRGVAMGTGFHFIVVGGGDGLLDDLEHRLHDLESRWSRFDPNSEVSRLNQSPNEFHLVSDDTVALINAAIAGWWATRGSFDPTVVDALIAHGYHTRFCELGEVVNSHEATSSPGCEGIHVGTNPNLVRLGAGVGFDPGGIGKGLAADLLVDHASQLGAHGCLVNLGGDLRCAGEAPVGNGWVVSVSEPSSSYNPDLVIALQSGAVATSTTTKRTWRNSSGRAHHLVDPATGQSTAGPQLATVIAAQGWYAEVVAKQLLVSGDPSVVDTTRAAALVVDCDGHMTLVGDMNGYIT